MNPEQEAQMAFVTADTNLRDAMKQYLKAATASQGQPSLDHIDIDKFVFIGMAKYRTGSMYHVGVSNGMETYEKLGLIEILKERDRS